MYLTTWRRRIVRLLLISIGLIYLPSIVGSTATSAQLNSAFIRRVRALEVDQAGVSNPEGLAFSSRARAFHLISGRVRGQPAPANTDFVKLTPFAQQMGLARIAAAIRDPLNVAFDNRLNRLLILRSPANQLVEVWEDANGNLDPKTLIRHNVQHFGLQNPQGLTVDPVSGQVFILDTSGPRLMRVERAADGSFGAAVISVVDLQATGLRDGWGLALDPSTRHLHIMSPAEQKLYELTQAGQLVATRDLSGLNLRDPQGMVFAPSGDLTDDPAVMNLYISDSGSSVNGLQNASPNAAPGFRLYLPLVLRGASGEQVVIPGPGPIARLMPGKPLAT